ncbi:MAG: GNAT family N-acetyltransferase [Alphaproteobacteria bacterium]|nr:GNAT family N-acetyltransferase [Alphaproteobacteria bacterium]
MLLTLCRAAKPEPRLVGRHVYLRPPRRGDWQQWAELRAVSRDFLTPWEPTWPGDALTQAAFRQRLARSTKDWADDLCYSFFIFRRADDDLVGGVTLSNVRRGVAQTASVGYWIGRPYARNGHMTDAVATLVAYAFDKLGLHRVEAACQPNNVPSRSLLKRVGFEEEGRARKYLRINGLWQDHVLLARLAEDR